jgi:pseudouridine kinase
MKICVIGGANIDITGKAAYIFSEGDSNPGTVRLSLGGVGRNIAHNLSLLGNEVHLLTIFGGGELGRMVKDSCTFLGINTEGCGTSGENSCFLSMLSSDGEMIGGISDMKAIGDLTAEWLMEREQYFNSADAVVADANLSAETLAYLIDNCTPPLYIDAVSGIKSQRVKEALQVSSGKVHSLKCNTLEAEALTQMDRIGRKYISLGAEGLRVEEGTTIKSFQSLPCVVVNTTGAGDALFAGIINAGPKASVEEAVEMGLQCAKITVESNDTVSDAIKNLKQSQ